MSRKEQQPTIKAPFKPEPIEELGDSPREIALAIHQIKIAMENQRRITDARFMQLHQHMELKQGVHPQRAVSCFQQAGDDEKTFMRCIQPPLPNAGKEQGGDDAPAPAPRRRRD